MADKVTAAKTENFESLRSRDSVHGKAFKKDAYRGASCNVVLGLLLSMSNTPSSPEVWD